MNVAEAGLLTLMCLTLGMFMSWKRSSIPILLRQVGETSWNEATSLGVTSDAFVERRYTETARVVGGSDSAGDKD